RGAGGRPRRTRRDRHRRPNARPRDREHPRRRAGALRGAAGVGVRKWRVVPRRRQRPRLVLRTGGRPGRDGRHRAAHFPSRGWRGMLPARASDARGDAMRRTGRILAVDDEMQVLEIYRKELEPLGWEIHTASTYVEAVDRLAEGDWALVLIDLKLRGARGPEEGLGLVREIEQHCPGAKAIVVTGYASPESIERAFAAGVYDYLEKTPSFTTLLRVKVENVMELQRQRWLAYESEDRDRTQARELWAA